MRLKRHSAPFYYVDHQDTSAHRARPALLITLSNLEQRFDRDPLFRNRRVQFIERP